MKLKEKYKNLWGFLIAYFGDYREGKSDKDIFDEVKVENSEDYLDQIHTEVKSLMSDQNYSVEDKNKFLLDANIYFKSDQEALSWLIEIEKLF